MAHDLAEQLTLPSVSRRVTGGPLCRALVEGGRVLELEYTPDNLLCWVIWV